MTECLSLVQGTSTRTLSNALNSFQSIAFEVRISRWSFQDWVCPRYCLRTSLSRATREIVMSLQTRTSELQGKKRQKISPIFEMNLTLGQTG